MTLQHLAPELYKYFLKIHASHTEPSDAVSELYQWFNNFFLQLAKDENLQFTTHFARIAYVCHKRKISNDLQWKIHHYRRLSQEIFFREKPFTDDEYRACYQVVAECVAELSEATIPNELTTIFPEKEVFTRTPLNIAKHREKVRVVVLENDHENRTFLVREDDPEQPQPVCVRYNIPGINEAFEQTIHQIDTVWKNQVTLNLIDVLVEEDGTYLPRVFIIEPDVLFDVTAVSECFQSFGTEPLLYLMKKFLPFASSIPILLGNAVNHLLDELMTDPEVDFLTTFKQAFHLSPLQFSMYNDGEIRGMAKKAQRHFFHLRGVVKQTLPEQSIGVKHCFLEPVFYSEKYGIQGRLDVWHNNPKQDQYAIVELKSGSPFRPNRHGLSGSHYTQTLLYDLLVRSVYGEATKTGLYILYSKLDENPLKFAPPESVLQHEALNIRNQLISIEENLIRLDKREYLDRNVLDRITPQKFVRASGFTKTDANFFSGVMGKMNVLERAYLLSFTAFIAREHRYAKTGIDGNDKSGGLASLWRSPFKTKQENFDIINHLTVIENHSRESDPRLVFEKTEMTTPLANFREGDIAVLYPTQNDDSTVLTNQIFKCNIIEMQGERVVVALRSKQFNDSLFREEKYWNLEHDLLDSGFTNLYRNLFAFVQFPDRKKKILLGLEAPEQAEIQDIEFNPDLSDEQGRILEKALSAEDYFLLIGPPGTGKTKFMLREMVKYILTKTSENILLLAYTNRAVDEICEAIDDFAKEDYMRIGSRHSTEETYRPRLFQEKIKGVTTRAGLREVIAAHRIVVSTVMSMGNRSQLLDLKRFDRVIIDEASQILEPMLVGLLPRLPRFILIGDHKQLPAVVVQSKEESAVSDASLLEIGLHNRRNSLFERLYYLCEKNKWTWAYDMLTHQGRMHGDISEFPNRFFYENELKLLPENCVAGAWQSVPLKFEKMLSSPTPLEKMIAEKRMIYIPTEVERKAQSNKINRCESRLVVELIHSFKNIYKKNNLPFNSNTLGVITPYRAQIAEIKNVLQQMNDPALNDISVDTVERYQGGARDIIIISLCLNTAYQMDKLVSMSDDGKVDRKLNVALTRARKHLVILGNRELMGLNGVYRELVEFLGG